MATWETDRLSLEEEQAALKTAKINRNPATWDATTTWKAAQVLAKAQQVKYQRQGTWN